MATAVGLTGLLAATQTHAVTLYSTGFESPGLAAGSPLVGQDGWVAGPPFLSPNAAVISTAVPQAGTQGVHTAYYDNFSINAVPEPATPGCVLLSGCGLLHRRRRTR